MIMRENVLREVLATYENQRLENRRVEEARRAEVSARAPVIATLLQERQELFYARVRAAFASPQTAQRTAQELEAELERINTALRTELQNIGYAQDYLQPVYRCEICHDTGYVGEPIHEQCSCLKQRVLKGLMRDENLRVLERQNFETYDDTVYPDTAIEGEEMTQRAYMRKLRDYCEAYANAFPKNEKPGMLFCGASGLGKTFLMHCIAQRVLERGHTVMILTAYRLLEIMRRNHYNGESAQMVEEILRCDLLLLDDLGAEPMVENVTIQSLYYILNERQQARRATIVSTNYSLSELRKAYTERVSSRLTDKHMTTLIRFKGADVRRG